jgi:glycosyltransferase involved in cell wall biosynthesis
MEQPSAAIRPTVSATVITFNEEADLEECLGSLRWCDEIVLVDSGSTDKTVEIATKRGVKLFVRRFQGFSDQKNFAAEQACGEWLLNIDADEVVTPELQEEIQRVLQHSADASGYFMPRLNLWLSHPMRHGGWYPDHALRLYRKNSGKWQGHSHEQVVVEGKTAVLTKPIVHKTIASMHDHLRKGLLSSVLELKEAKSNKLRFYWLPPGKVLLQCLKDFWAGPKTMLGLRMVYKRRIKNAVDFVWLLPWYPFLRFFYMYFLRLGFLDGSKGFWLAYSSAIVEAMKYLKIWEYYFHQGGRPGSEEKRLDDPAVLYRSIS